MQFAFYAMIALILLGVAAYLHFYLRRLFRLWRDRKPTGRQNVWIWLFSVALALPMLQISSMYTLILLHFVVISAILNLAYTFSRHNRKVGLICSSGILALGVTALVLGLGAYNMFHVVRTDYTLHTDKDVQFTIVQLADVHTTDLTTPERLTGTCEEISQRNPDVVLLTGDIFEEQTTLEDMRAVCQELGNIKCKYGVFFSYGNHDNSFYTDTPNYTPAQLQAALVENGITILCDEVTTIGNVTLVGRSDISLNQNRKPTAELLRGTDPDNYIVVMDHQPLDLEENAAAGADLQLSGHTHGGQIFPLGLLTELFAGRLNAGSRTIGDFTAITSTGFAGWGYPVKTEGRSEYVTIEIQPN